MNSTITSVDLFGFGHCCADYLMVLDPYPAKGCKGDVVESLVIGGGPVPTACAAAVKFGLSARFAGKVGADADGEVVIRGLREAGVDDTYMLIEPAVKTARACIWIDPKDHGARTVALDLIRFQQPSADELDDRLPALCRALLVDGRASEACLKALNLARKKDVITILDTGAVRPCFKEMLQLTDFAIVSYELALAYLPGGSPLEVAEKLISDGAEYAVVTFGESGAYWMSKNSAGFAPGFPQPLVVDTTGAGDIFHGAFIYKLLENSQNVHTLSSENMNGIIRFANAAAALSTRKLSGRLSIPDLKEALDLTAEHSDENEPE